MIGQLRSVDYALVNTETNEVLRTSTFESVLDRIAGHMTKSAQDLGRTNVTNYVVMEMRRATMGNVLYDKALEVRWQEAQRRQRA
jgi:hypothetical protein